MSAGGRAFLVDGVRTPIGRYGGVLANIRPDDLAAMTIRELVRHAEVDGGIIDDVVLGCANQAGEDNRNVARMAGLLAGLPETVSATTVNRLCGSGADAIAIAARAIKVGEAEVILAGGVESMTRAPFVLPKSTTAYSRVAEVQDTTIGWRLVNPVMEALYGIDSMGQTAENVASEYGVTREAQDAFALRSQTRAAAAIAAGRFKREIIPVEVPQPRSGIAIVDQDEHPRPTTLSSLTRLRPAFRHDGSVTAGNAAGINDGAAALMIASESAVEKYGLTPLAEVTGCATAGVLPRVMGLGPVPATEKLLQRQNLKLKDVDLIELNEAFAAQAVAVLRMLGVDPAADYVNPNGGAIALGHPLGMTGARLALTAALELESSGAGRALVTMCIGVGQGIALMLERAH